MADAEHTTADRCYKHKAEDTPSLLQNGDLIFQTYHVGWIIASFFTIVATLVSFWLVDRHLQWYTNKREQRYIIRILFLVPLYAIISLLSYFFWNHSVPLILVRDTYEAIVLTAFFYLLLVYLSPDPHEQRMIFLKYGLSREADREAIRKKEEIKRWVWPMGFVKAKPADGLYFLQLMKWGILQYCVLKPLTTIAAIVLDYMGLYCEESWGLGWGHVYIVIIVSVSVTVAMYNLIQLYVVVSEQLKPFRPLLKLFAIKAVVFLTFWQATGLAVLAMFGVVKSTKHMTAADINIGIGALLQTFEMMLFAFLHVKAFSYKPYRPFHDPSSEDPKPERTPRWRSLCHAMNFRETFREIGEGWVYMWAKLRGKKPHLDGEARQVSHFSSAFGRERQAEATAERKPFIRESEKVPNVHNHSEIAPRRYSRPRDDARDYLRGSDYRDNGRREKSEALGIQIERELERRGFGSNIPGRGHIGRPHDDYESDEHARPPRSWWRNVYDRVSQSSPDDAQIDNSYGPPSRRRPKSRDHSRHRTKSIEATQGLLQGYNTNLNDPPPVSYLRQSGTRPMSQVVHDSPRANPLLVSRQSEAQRFQFPHPSTRIDRTRLTMPTPLSSSPHQSNDSLLGRVFPSPSDLSHAAPSTTHLISHEFGYAGERAGYFAPQDHKAPPKSHSGHIMHSVNEGGDRLETSSHHSRESSFYDALSDFEQPTEGPLLSPLVGSPTREPMPKSPPSGHNNTGSPPRQSVTQLRRQSLDPATRQARQQSQSKSPQMPAPSYDRHRTSPPYMAVHSPSQGTRPIVAHHHHHYNDSRDSITTSTIAQPSYSGQMDPTRAKFASSRPDFSRYNNAASSSQNLPCDAAPSNDLYHVPIYDNSDTKRP